MKKSALEILRVLHFGSRLPQRRGRRGRSNRILAKLKGNHINRLLSILFPPKLPRFDLRELKDSHCYLHRITRHGVEPKFGQIVGARIGPAVEKQIFLKGRRRAPRVELLTEKISVLSLT